MKKSELWYRIEQHLKSQLKASRRNEDTQVSYGLVKEKKSLKMK